MSGDREWSLGQIEKRTSAYRSMGSVINGRNCDALPDRPITKINFMRSSSPISSSRFGTRKYNRELVYETIDRFNEGIKGMQPAFAELRTGRTLLKVAQRDLDFYTKRSVRVMMRNIARPINVTSFHCYQALFIVQN